VSIVVDEMEQEFVALAHEFAEKELRPVAADFDESEEYPWDVLRKAAEVGLVSYDLPEEYGGGGVDSLLTKCKINEELAWGDAAMAEVIWQSGFCAGPLLAAGTEEQKQRWIAPMCEPEPATWGIAITEPGCGSDVAAMKTSAKKVDGGYLLNGSKTWISNAPVADHYGVFANLTPGESHKGITLFVVERGDEGFSTGAAMPKMGQRAFPAAELFFDDCFVPEDRRVGDECRGFGIMMRWFNKVRADLAGHCLGIGRAALEYAVEYAKERQAFGTPIHGFQAVSFRLVDAKVKLDQARLLCHHAARLADAGEDFTVEAAAAKLAASEAATETAQSAMRTLGGYGYSREYPVERYLRDALLELIEEGTNDIQKLIIARSMFHV